MENTKKKDRSDIEENIQEAYFCKEFSNRPLSDEDFEDYIKFAMELKFEMEDEDRIALNKTMVCSMMTAAEIAGGIRIERNKEGLIISIFKNNI